MGASSSSATPTRGRRNRGGRKLRVLIDTNVVLDQLLRREPWYTDAQAFWQARDARQIVTYLPASVLTDIFYISRRQVGITEAHTAVGRCLSQFGIIAVNRALLTAAAAMPGSDFEDNVQIACAQHAALDLIVTRDPDGFRDAPMPAVEPAEAARRASP